jgi:hypothetical protein
MRNVLYFIPALVFAAFYGWVLIGTGLSVSPFVYIWIALFVLSGILMAQGRFWGGVPGVLPGLHMMYMSTVDTGQIINIELPMGIIVAAFYLACAGYLFNKSGKQ